MRVNHVKTMASSSSSSQKRKELPARTPESDGAPPFSTPSPLGGEDEQQQQRQSGASRVTAPSGKPKAPPLIQRKIKPDEAGIEAETCSGSGSKIPLLKTKQSDREFLADEHGRVSNSTKIYGSNRQSMHDLYKSRSKNSLPERVHRSVDKVKLAKGIEMKRVVQESNGVMSKRFSSTGLAASSSTKTFKESSQRSRSNEALIRRKMTKSEASFPSVKSYNTPRSTRESTNAETGKPVKKRQTSTSASPHKQTSDEKAAIDAASSFKTVEEFLKMPETSLPDGGSGTKKTLFKSKFWEYIDPTKQLKESKGKQTKKAYNSDEVKSFMEKQKEIRRLQQVKASQERQLEAQKRQRLLKDLDSRCQKIASKGKHKDDSPPPQQNLEVNLAKKRKMELESPSLKYLKPLLEHKQSGLRRRSENFRVDTAKQAQYLLSEFENIVKRECISFLNRIPMPNEQNLSSPIVEKVDKGVGTSIADPETESMDITSEKEENFEVSDDRSKMLVPSPATVEKAAATIQAFYRGNKVRQALREAKIQLRKPWNKSEEVEQQHARHRRWSFPKPPEKPYDNSSLHGRLLPMSPIPMSVKTIDPLIPCYIPPPPRSASSQSSRSPTRPKVLPSSPFTPVKLRVYDDPYPKQMKRTTEGHSTADTAAVQQDLPKAPTIDDFFVPTPLPSIVDVLREKIRLFSDTALVAPPVTTTERHQPHGIHENLSEMLDKAVSAHIDSARNAHAPPRVHREDQESSTTPKLKKHKRHSRTRARHKSPVEDSTTTADTDLEYVDGASQSHSMATLPTSQKHNSDATSCRSESSLQTTPSAVNEPSISSSFGDFLAPALRLRYEAEREHLKIIEKALQVKLTDSRKAAEPVPVQSEKSESRKETGKKSSPESDRVQLAIANCHKESMKAAAEMAKWMSDFQKTTQQQEKVQQTSSVDLAALVYAAVEEARTIGEERRREKQLQEASYPEVKLSHSFPCQNQRSVPDRILQNGEDVFKVDKSVETSLSLQKEPNENAKPVDVLFSARVSKHVLKDYQQQFPSASDSDRETPASEPLSASLISEHFTKISTVLEDYSKSAKSVKDNDSVELITPLLSSSSTIKSASSIISAEGETPKTGSVQLLLQTPANYSSTSIQEPETDQDIRTTEKEADKSVEEEILSEFEVEDSQILSLNQDLDVEAAEDKNDKSPEISMAPVGSEKDATEKNESVTSINQIPDESMKDDPEPFPSTFESDVDSPIPSKQSLEVEYETIESDLEESLSSISSVNIEVNSRKSESPVEEESKKSLKESSPPCPATYSIESDGSLTSTSPRHEVTGEVHEENEDIVDEEKVHEEKPQEDVSEFLSENLEVSTHDELILPIDASSKIENEITVEDNVENVQIPDESFQDSQQHVSSEYESEEESLGVPEAKSETPSITAQLDEANKDRKQNVEVESTAKPTIHETIEDLESPIKSVIQEEVEELESPEKSGVQEDIEENNTPEKSAIQEDLEELESPVKSAIQKDIEEVESPEKSSIQEDVEELESPVKSGVQETVDVLESPVKSSIQKDIEELESPEKSSIQEDVEELESPVISTVQETVEDLGSPLKSAIQEDAKEFKSHVPAVEVQENIEELQSPAPAIQETAEILSVPMKPPPPYSSSSTFKVQSPSGSSPTRQEFEQGTFKDIKEPVTVQEDIPTPAIQPDFKQVIPNEDNTASDFNNETKLENNATVTERLIGRTEDTGSKDGHEPASSGDFFSSQNLRITDSEFTKLDQTRTEIEIPLKPPPPYSPSSSLDSTSLSSRSLIISLQRDRIQRIVQEQVELIWDTWKSGFGNGELFPDVTNIISRMTCDTNQSQDQMDVGRNGNQDLTQSAVQSFDSLLHHLVYETIKEVLQIENSFTSYIERVRPGPLALQAQKLKIPKTKESLISSVITRVSNAVPSHFFSEPYVQTIEKYKGKKWCSRPKELVDEILLEELVEEDYQWTEWWPEQVIVEHIESKEIIKGMINRVLKNRKYVYSQ